MTRRLTVEAIARHIGGAVEGDARRSISGAASLESASAGDIVFAIGPEYQAALASSRAGAAILPEGLEAPPDMSVIRFSQAQLGMARALDILYPPVREFEGVSPQALIGKDVVLGDDVAVGPGSIITEGVRVGRGTEIHANVTIGRGTVIGESCLIYSGVHIYPEVSIGSRVVVQSGTVIGAPGFGVTQEMLPGKDGVPAVRHRMIPQVGRVVIEDDVDIGCNCVISRGALDPTWIGCGSKIDSLVMIGHNCRIGRHAAIAAQTGLAGSTIFEDYVTAAGQTGFAGHIRVGTGSVIGAQAGVTKDVRPGTGLFGTPAMEIRKARRALPLLERLPEMRKTLLEHEKRLASLEEAGG
jgi:UDP-3-O-[3-hydroxymyristoyl] glucosamine N-acyltransferase